MRRLACLAAFAILATTAAVARGAPAHPAAPPRQPTPAEKAELDRLDAELRAAQGKQAWLAAAKVARKLYTLQRQATGEDSIDAQRRKYTLASTLNGAGDWGEALKLYEELLHTAESDHGPESRETLYAIMPINGIYWVQGRYEDLEPLNQRMLAITKKLDGERSLAYANQLTSYGAMLFTRNEYSSAERAYEQSLTIREALASPKDEASLISALQVLANLYWNTNRQQRAIALYDRSVALAESAQNTPIITRAAWIWAVSAAYHYGGREDLAAPLVKRAVAFYTAEIARLEKEKPDDWQLPVLLGQLGNIYRQSGDLANADRTLTRVVAMAQKRTGYSGWESTLAEVKHAEGKPREALALYEQARAALAKTAPQAATAFNSVTADLLREMGEYARAEKLYEEQRAETVKRFGTRHPLYASILLGESRLYASAGKLPAAERALTESLEASEKELRMVLRGGTESDHAVFFARNSYQLDVAINFQLNYAPKSASAARLGLTTLLRRKGRVLDAAAAAVATIRAKLAPEDKKLLDELASVRAQLAKLTLAGAAATGGDAGDYAKAVAALEERLQRLEVQVSKKSAAYRVVSEPIELAPVQKMIPADARLVEMVNFQPLDPKNYAALKPALPPRRYGAYVVGTKGDPSFVDLGDAAAIDAAIEKFRKAVSDPDNDRAVELGQALYRLTMAKVIPRLGGATNVLIAPDGALNLVPFAALVDEQGQFLIKKYTFTYPTSGRDLLRLKAQGKAQGGGLIFANPSFDATTPESSPDGKGTTGGGGTRGRRSADLASTVWRPLPGTAQEAEQVGKTMPGLKLLRGEEATEGALKAARAPRILHLATHGFFLSDETPPAAAGEDGAAAAAPGPMPAQAAPGGGTARENPLLRSGLVLAGANKLRSGNEDGILTAMEASGLDLEGTKLVVLSACETGVGKVTNGEGVYGLRRALVIAGAESLVMTLWQVDDLATRDLMTGYYTRLSSGKGRSAALRDIQLEIASRPKYGHPYYWASFLAAGANTPINKD
jgi:CHAT domain-containing protein